MDSSTITGGNLSLSQTKSEATHRHRRPSTSSSSKTKRRRSKSSEHNCLSKRTKTCPKLEPTELTIPSATTTFNNLDSHTNGYTSLIVLEQEINHISLVSAANPSLIKTFSTNLSKARNKTKLEHVEFSQRSDIHQQKVSHSIRHHLPVDPRQWTVVQVADFISRLIKNNSIRDLFYDGEINGRALLLITYDFLHGKMKINLGPSLIISNEIAKLREIVKTLS